MSDSNESTSETFTFQAEINQLMSLIINTFYSNKDIFLRELVANASDAIDKQRFNDLQNSKMDGEYKISVQPDRDNNTLIIEDNGIGMTKGDLINNLGTIAKSGTKGFLETLDAGADISCIGQFGVGFYSAFLVAESVRVVSRHEDDEAYEWVSSAGGTFEVRKTSEAIERGTRLILTMKGDQLDYLKESKIKEILKRHNSFINYPINLYIEKEEEVEVTDEEDEHEPASEPELEPESDNEQEPVSEQEPEPEPEPELDDDDRIKDVEEEEEEKDEGEGDKEDDKEDDKKEKKTKTVKQVSHEWEQQNKIKPVWMMNQKDVTHDQYSKFYKNISNDWSDHFAVKHFKVEGQLEFRCLLFVPERRPFDMFSPEKKKSNIKLYVRRVFIMDDCKELIPDYLDFMVGIVDSDDLPLNISREVLQQNKIIKIMRKNIVKHCLSLFEEMAEDEEKYAKFYGQFATNLKLGLHEDQNNVPRLSKLVRFNTSHNVESLFSFDDYVRRMKEGQKDIYYIQGENINTIKNSPFLENFDKNDIEVILFTDAIDVYILNNLKEYEGKNLVCVSKDGLELPLSEDEEKDWKGKVGEWGDVCKHASDVLGDRVEKVVLSQKLFDSPCCISTGQYGHTAYAERIFKAQTMADKSSHQHMNSQKTMEINPDNSIIKELKKKYDADKGDKTFGDILHLLYETGLLVSGFDLDEPDKYANRLNRMITMGLGLADEDEEEDDLCDACPEPPVEEEEEDVSEMDAVD